MNVAKGGRLVYSNIEKQEKRKNIKVDSSGNEVNQKQNEILVVSKSHTFVQPNTVMVHSHNASLASPANITRRPN